MDTGTRYVVYLTAAANGNPVGYVVNAVLWDGAAPYAAGAGTALLADTAGAHAIGSTITVPTSS